MPVDARCKLVYLSGAAKKGERSIPRAVFQRLWPRRRAFQHGRACQSVRRGRKYPSGLVHKDASRSTGPGGKQVWVHN